jgi:hypothetical protein
VAPGTITRSCSQRSARGAAIQREHFAIPFADGERRRRAHAREYVGGRQIGAAAARDHSADRVAEFGGGDERRRCPRARAEQPDRQPAQRRLAPRPATGGDEPPRQQRDVEACRALGVLVGRQQIDEQRGEADLVEHARDVAVARRKPARAAAVREQHEAARRFGPAAGQYEIARQRDAVGGDRDGAQIHRACSRTGMRRGPNAPSNLPKRPAIAVAQCGQRPSSVSS